MINETKKRGNLFMYLGLMLAAVSTILIFQQLSAKPEPPAPESYSPVLFLAEPLSISTSIRDALNAETFEVDSVCPPPSIEQQAAGIRPPAYSPAIGAFQVCAIPQRMITPSMIVLPELQLGDPTDQESLQMLLNNTALVHDAISSQLGNAFVTTDLQSGDILQQNMLDSNGGLNNDMRAVSIPVDQVTSVGGTIRPGQRVDVVVSYETRGEGNERIPFTELLLQNVEVLSVSAQSRFYAQNNQFVDDRYSSDYISAEPQRAIAPTGEILSNSTVTLALNLEDAMRVTFMSNFAREVRLLTRRSDDGVVREVAPITQDALNR